MGLVGHVSSQFHRAGADRLLAAVVVDDWTTLCAQRITPGPPSPRRVVDATLRGQAMVGAVGVMGELRLVCAGCGPVVVTTCAAEVHHNRADGFRLLVAPCPRCTELLATAEPLVLDRAVAAGARTRELRRPAPELTSDDALELRRLLADDDWCARLAAGDA